MTPQVPGEFPYRADPAAHGVPDLLPIACMGVGPLQRRSHTSSRAAFLLALALTPAGFGLAGVASATESVAQDEQRSLAARFDAEIAPFLKTNCLGCHGRDSPEGDISLLNLEGDPAVESSVAVWWQVLEQLEIGAMPPEDEHQPTAAEREEIVSWIKETLIAAGKGFELESRLMLPEFGNRVSHELLFDGSIQDLPASPSRLWRMSPFIFKGKRLQPQTAGGIEAEPITYSTKSSGIRDYSSQEIVGEAGFLSLLMAYDDIISSQLHDREIAAMSYGPTAGQTRVVAGKASFKAISEAVGTPSDEAMELVIGEEFLRVTGRPIEDAELARYVGFLKTCIRQSDNATGLKFALLALYLTPEAIYRLELGLGPEDQYGRRILGPPEIAYAISYALTDTPPLGQRPIQAALESEKLSTAADVEVVVREMLKNPKAMVRVGRFFSEFFEYPKMEGVFKDNSRGTYGPRVTLGEAHRFVAKILEEDQHVFEELLASPRFNQNADALLKELDDQYAEKAKTLSGEKAEEERKQYLSTRKDRASRWRNETFRAGILTHPAWLIAHSKCVENDPIHRGKWIRERLLAGGIPELPIDVDAKLPEDHSLTLRQRLQVTEAESCWKCHRQMNPLGTPFEMYDDFGRYRPALYFDQKRERFIDQKGHLINELKTNDIVVALPVETDGMLRGTGDPELDGEVSDAVDLVQRLAKSSRVRQSIIRHAFRFWMGRNETLSDSKTLIAADRAYVESGGSFNAVLVALLTSDSFLYRK